MNVKSTKRDKDLIHSSWFWLLIPMMVVVSNATVKTNTIQLYTSAINVCFIIPSIL